MVLAETIAGLGAFKTMFDTAKALKDMNDANIRNAAVSDLWEQIFTAQTRYAASIEQIRELEEKLATFENWETEKQRYELAEPIPGVRVYRIKESMRGDELPHEICATCYAHKHISILQRQTWSPGRCHVLICNDCGSVVYLHGIADAAHKALRPTPLPV
jgi:hypothetical protein